jgi:diaminobutyrate-2-oxoglutarate transaminase
VVLGLRRRSGALDYGHNHPVLQQALLSYLQVDGVTHSLDMSTSAELEFVSALREHVLAPRGLDYRVQFTGPTGTNGVEAALKLARNVTGRSSVAAFTGAFHGLTFEDPALAAPVSARAFARGQLVETSGSRGEVVKLLPPLVISESEPAEGLDMLAESVAAAAAGGA